MVVIKKLPSLRIIRGFKGTIDFYVYMGQSCARSWPSPPRAVRNANVQAGWAAFSYISKQWNTLEPLIQTAYRQNTSGTNLTARDLLIKNYITPQFLKLHASPPIPANPTTGKWFLTQISIDTYPTEPRVTCVTDELVHLTLYYTRTLPQKHPLTRVERGLAVPWYTRWCFVAWQEVEQNEAGDTLTHTFDMPFWLDCQTIYFAFRGTVGGELSPSCSCIFTHHMLHRGLFQHYTIGEDGGIGVWGPHWSAQLFTPQRNHHITKVVLKLYRQASPGLVTVSVRTTQAGKPIGSDMATGTVDGDSFQVNPGVYEELPLDEGCDLTAGVQYAIVLRAPFASGTPDFIVWRWNSAGGYPANWWCSTHNSGATWAKHLVEDLMFEEWGWPIYD